jgi:hypothetical protein
MKKEHCRKDTKGRKEKYSEKNVSSATCSTINLTRRDLGMKTGLGEFRNENKPEL